MKRDRKYLKTMQGCSHGAVRRLRPSGLDEGNAPQGRGYNICQLARRSTYRLAALLLLVSPHANACDMCKYARELTISAQELVYAERSVLAMPMADRNEFRIVAVIKGD